MPTNHTWALFWSEQHRHKKSAANWCLNDDRERQARPDLTRYRSTAPLSGQCVGFLFCEQPSVPPTRMSQNAVRTPYSLWYTCWSLHGNDENMMINKSECRPHSRIGSTCAVMHHAENLYRHIYALHGTWRAETPNKMHVQPGCSRNTHQDLNT